VKKPPRGSDWEASPEGPKPPLTLHLRNDRIFALALREAEGDFKLGSMLMHRALGRDLDSLSVAIIDNKRAMLAVMRAMLAAIGVGRIETFESPTEALGAIRTDVPDVVIAASAMQPLTGYALVKTMRRGGGEPLCFVPAVIMSTQARPSDVEDALRAGAHQVLVLPTSASTLYRRLDWLLNDDRPYELAGDHYVIAGMEQRLSLSHQRPTYARLRAAGSLAAALHREEPLASAPAALEPVHARAARR
jgi:two-component system chemotaxis response regulator CheY